MSLDFGAPALPQPLTTAKEEPPKRELVMPPLPPRVASAAKIIRPVEQWTETAQRALKSERETECAILYAPFSDEPDGINTILPVGVWHWQQQQGDQRESRLGSRR